MGLLLEKLMRWQGLQGLMMVLRLSQGQMLHGTPKADNGVDGAVVGS